MTDHEFLRDVFSVLKGVAAIQSRHQEALEGIFRSLTNLNAALMAQFGYDTAEDAGSCLFAPRLSPAQAAEALRKAAADVRELRRIFDQPAAPLQELQEPPAGAEGQL